VSSVAAEDHKVGPFCNPPPPIEGNLEYRSSAVPDPSFDKEILHQWGLAEAVRRESAHSVVFSPQHPPPLNDVVFPGAISAPTQMMIVAEVAHVGATGKGKHPMDAGSEPDMEMTVPISVDSDDEIDFGLDQSFLRSPPYGSGSSLQSVPLEAAVVMSPSAVDSNTTVRSETLVTVVPASSLCVVPPKKSRLRSSEALSKRKKKKTEKDSNDKHYLAFLRTHVGRTFTIMDAAIKASQVVVKPAGQAVITPTLKQSYSEAITWSKSILSLVSICFISDHRFDPSSSLEDDMLTLVKCASQTYGKLSTFQGVAGMQVGVGIVGVDEVLAFFGFSRFKQHWLGNEEWFGVQVWATGSILAQRAKHNSQRRAHTIKIPDKGPRS